MDWAEANRVILAWGAAVPPPAYGWLDPARRGCRARTLAGNACLSALSDPETCARHRPRVPVGFPQHEATNYVYFVGGGGLVKVGRAIDVPRRFSGLQAASPVPLELVRFLRAPVALEPALHAHLADHRSHGEWFRPSSVLDELLALSDAGLLKRLGFRGADRVEMARWLPIQAEIDERLAERRMRPGYDSELERA